MPAKIQQIYIEQGADFSLQIDTEFDLTGYDLRGKIGKSHDANRKFPFSFTVDDAAAGTFTLTLSNYYTSLLGDGLYQYDVEAFTPNDASVIRAVQGKAIVSGEVTT